MISTAIVIFREVVEIALIVGIILAATKNLVGRNWLVINGLIGGIFGSILIAGLASKITDLLDGMGQEYLNSLLLTITVLLIGWTVIWMNKNAPKLAMEIKTKSAEIIAGRKPLYMITIIIATSVLREGAEVILFLSGIHAAGSSIAEMIPGAAMGGFLGLVVGAAIYFGLIRLSTKYLFSVTSWLLILLACGMSAQVASYLSAAEILIVLDSPLWDSSWLILNSSITGRILHTLFGYNSNPTGMELIFYLSTLIIISFSLYTSSSTKKTPKT